MIAASIILLSAGLSTSQPDGSAFNHAFFCTVMQLVAGQPSTQPGTKIARFVHHGGVTVSCEDRSVEIRTVLSRPVNVMGKGWLATQKRYWMDDTCNDPMMAHAVEHGWHLQAVILVGPDAVASFATACGR